MQPGIIFLICVAVIILISFFIWICSRYKKCPSDKIMVVYGSIGKNTDALTAVQSVFTVAQNLLCPYFSLMHILI